MRGMQGHSEPTRSGFDSRSGLLLSFRILFFIITPLIVNLFTAMSDNMECRIIEWLIC